MPAPWDDLGANVLDAFDGQELGFHAASVLATTALSLSGMDHAARVEAQQRFSYEHYSDFANYSGYVLPVVVGPTLYVTGLLTESIDTIGAGSAVLQAVAVTLTTTFVLKLATGRPFPLHGEDPRAPDRLKHPEYAREFRPFSLQIAWPSGHTSASVTIAAALTGYFPEEPLVPLLTYPVAVAVGLGMIAGDHHWTSDVIAGGLIGHAIGYRIGANFHERVSGRKPNNKAVREAPNLMLIPFARAPYGASLVGFW